MTEQDKQELREMMALVEAQRTQKSVVYVDTDGCEVKVTPAGHVFYNIADWY